MSDENPEPYVDPKPTRKLEATVQFHGANSPGWMDAEKGFQQKVVYEASVEDQIKYLRKVVHVNRETYEQKLGQLLILNQELTQFNDHLTRKLLMVKTELREFSKKVSDL
jgi:hypothetical protein